MGQFTFFDFLVCITCFVGLFAILFAEEKIRSWYKLRSNLKRLGLR